MSIAVVSFLICALAQPIDDGRPVVYDPPPLTATIAKNSYDLSLPFVPPREETPLVEKWWFWAAIFGAVAVTAGGVVMIAALTDRADPSIEKPVPIFERDL